MYKQQKQSEIYFEANAKKWAKKSNFNKNALLNTIQQRNLYVLKQFKNFKLKNLLDIGSGVGDLSFAASKYAERSVGIDFSQNMIDLANNSSRIINN